MNHCPKSLEPRNCPQPGQTAQTSISGGGNALLNLTLRYTNNHGLSITGDHNRVENILVDNTGW